MRRKVNVGLSFLLILCLCVSMVAGVSLPVSAATTWTDRSVQQQIFTNTALAYFYKGDAMQYGSYYIASGYRYAGGITRGTPNRSPEDATSEDKLYNVCSAYPHDIYFEAFGEHILTDEMVIPATSQIHSVNFETDSVNSDFLTSVQNSTENYCYHGAMAKAAGFDVDTVDVDARKNTADTDNVYADVLYYFGPDLDSETGDPITYATRKEDCSGGNLYTISSGVATLAKTTGAASYSSTSITTNVTATIDGETLSTYFYLVEDGEESYYITTDSYTFDRNNSINGLTAAQVDQIFAEELQPGDVIAVMYVSDVTGSGPSGGHTMTYIGDIDGDGVGEIIHSKGSKYNNANQQLVSGDTSTSGYKRYVTQNIYDMASVKDASKNTFYYESAVHTTDYLTGYDLVEGVAGWSVNNFDGKNGYGLTNSATLCPGNGGNIAIEDWFSQLGPYAGLTSADQKVNPTGEYGVDYFPYNTSLETTGGFYPGGDRSLLQSGAVACSQFCVLRPLNSSRFNAGAWQEGSNTTKGRYAMGDLSVTKTASLTEKETLAAGAEITYTIELWNPDTVLAVNNSGSYTVNLTETLPANAQLVKGSLQCSSGVTGSTGTGTVTWNGITVDQGDKVTVSYTVKVSASASRGDHVVSPEGTVELAGDSSAILNTKEYVHTVSGAELTDPQLDTLLSLRAEYAITDTGRGMDIANQVYEKLGADPAFPDTNTLLQDLLEIDDWSQKENAKGNYYKVKLSDNSKLAALMVPGYVGGRRLMTYDEEGIKTTENRLVSFNECYLEPGDILVCANVRERSSYFTLDDAEVYVYLGKTDANHTYYAHYNDAGKYEVVNAPLKDIQIGESRVRYQYSPVLTAAMLDDFFVLLRPTLGADDVSSYVSPVAAADESSAEAAKIGDTGYATLTDALNAAAAGDTITVAKDICLENEVGNNSNKAYPLVINKNLTLDLNGHTISDQGVAGDGTALKALLLVSGGTVTVQNGTLHSEGTVAALSTSGAVNLTLKDMNVINTVSRAVRRTAGSSGDLIISGGFYSGEGKTLPTIDIDTGKSETATANLYLCNAVVVHSKNAPLVLRMGDNAAAVISEATLTTNAQSYDENLYSGTVSTDALVVDAIPVHSEFLYGRRYYPADTKAVIGNEKYTSLSAAITAAKAGDTITLVTDIYTEEEPGTKVGSSIPKYPLQTNFDLTLDLNGYTIDDTGDTVHVPSGADHLSAAFRITGGTVEIKNGTISSAGTGAAVSLGETARVTFTDMVITNTTAMAVYVSTNSDCRVTVSGGYFKTAGTPVYASAGSTVVTVENGAVLHSGTANAIYMADGNCACLRRAVLATDAKNYQPRALFTGNVTTDKSYAYLKTVTSVTVKDTVYALAYGELYDLDVKAVIGETSYLSLSEALAAAQPGDTVTLVDDIRTEDEPGHKVKSVVEKYPLQIGMDLVLDLNGYTIDDTTDTVHMPSGADHLGAPIRITGGTVEIKNGTIRSAGTAAGLSVGNTAQVTLTNLELFNTVSYGVYISVNTTGSVTLSDCYCFGAVNAVKAGGGSAAVTVKDGTILQSGTDQVLDMGSGTQAYLQKTLLLTNAGSYQPQALFAGSVTVDEGYAYRSSVPSVSRKHTECVFIYADYYDLVSVNALIGNVGYSSLSDALDAAQKGDTITLVSDIDTELETGNKAAGSQINKYPFYIKYDLTLDLNGHTIDDTADTIHIPSGDSHLGAPLRTNAGCVTIKNGSIRSCGTAAAVSVGGSAQLTLMDVNVINTVSPAVFVSNGASATLTISGGLYQTTADRTICVSTGSTVITFKDGVVLYSQASEAIYVGSGNTAYLQRAVLATDAPDDKVSTLFTGPVTADSDEGYVYRSKITYATVNGEILEFAQGEYYDLTEVKVLIGVTGYTSLSDALTAAQDGDTITLVSDIFTENEPGCNLTAQDNEDYPLLIQTDLTLDLNGHTIDDTGDTLKAPIRVISGTVELKNGTIHSAGTVAAISIRSMAEVIFTDVTLIGSEVHYCKESTATVDATCTTNGSVTDTCSTCGDKQVEIIPATGHSFKNGTCGTCGQVDPEYVAPVVQPTLTLKSPTLEFKDMICIVAFYTAENTEDVVEMGMITYKEKVTQWSVETADCVIPGADYDESSGRYYSSSQGIHAKYLADTVYLACYAKLSDGSYVYTKLAPYSPITYAVNQLKNSTDTSLKQLVAAMLNYGAEAQLYFGHNVETLANASLTGNQLALPEAYRADMVAVVPAVDSAKQGIFANNQGFSVRKPAISFEGAFCINYFFTPAYAPVNGITLYYWNETDYNRVDVLTVENASGFFKLEGSGTEQYCGDIVGISAKNLSQAVYVAAVYSDGTTEWTSGVLGYSIGAYCSSQASKGGDVAALAMATAVYGFHAKQYFS